ncbi:MAG: hypothetical protein H7Y42_10440 [Chitinophagaceae bacterium]|nr:hypothetical protein [Chitinophagaceae bacterium]
MRRFLGMATLTMMMMTGNAQLSDKQYIKQLCGCFDVTFKYAETFSPDANYKYHDREEINGGTELIFVVEESDRKLVLQHLLVITDSMIIKHWREDWRYEDTISWKYIANRVWEKERIPASRVKGQWTQGVWEVSDAPRYQGTSDWMSIDGKVSWQNTTDAPLPRREYSVRNDYNILKRTNRLVIGDSGWVHDQDNQKIIRENGKDRLLVEEKGVNVYKRITDANCASAKLYWDKNKDYWGRVRTIWNNILDRSERINLQTAINGKPLHDHLFQLAKEYSTGRVNATDVDSKISGFVREFLATPK